MSKPQPGSIAAENGVFGLAFDMSGTRLLTAECDKTIKYYREDEDATEETHPVKDYKIEFDRRWVGVYISMDYLIFIKSNY